MNSKQRKQQMKRNKQFHTLLVQMMEGLADEIESRKESPEECVKAIREVIAEHKEGGE